MRVMIVAAFDYYDDIRIKYVRNYFLNCGFQVNCVITDYSHMSKKKSELSNNYIKIKTKPYGKNISIKRLYSHIDFSRKALKVIKDYNPDLLYSIIPPNSLAWCSAKYKKAHPNTILIYDLFDLWPETMPINKMPKLLKLPFVLWGKLRNNSLPYADFVITECDLYQNELEIELKNSKCDSVYICKKKHPIYKVNDFNNYKIEICYLGSINNIIDISIIEKILVAINNHKEVILHIIGDGENRDALINQIKKHNIAVNFYGKVFEEQEKKKIMKKCDFGLNIMKESVVVGLTMKSIDYFEAGLPILNNIKSDTYGIVEKNKIGYNIFAHNIESIAKEISNLSEVELQEMKNNTEQVFENYFSVRAFEEKLECVMEMVMKEHK